MKPLILLILLLLTFLILISFLGNENSPSEFSPLNNSKSPTVIYNNSNSNFSYQPHQSQPTLNRDSILKKSINGYREQTYWGSEHPIQKKTEHLNDKQFKRFVEDEVKSENADLYWGAEY